MATRCWQSAHEQVFVENHSDILFAKFDEPGPETAACMAVMADRVRRE